LRAHEPEALADKKKEQDRRNDSVQRRTAPGGFRGSISARLILLGLGGFYSGHKVGVDE